MCVCVCVCVCIQCIYGFAEESESISNAATYGSDCATLTRDECLFWSLSVVCVTEVND